MNYLHAENLKNRHWTKAMVREFLPRYDRLLRHGNMMLRMYATDRVEAIEASPEWSARRQLADKRRATQLGRNVVVFPTA